MWYLFKKLIFGHVHVWETEAKYPYRIEYRKVAGGGGREGIVYVQRCKACGALKKFEVN